MQPAELVQLILKARALPDSSLSKTLTDAGTFELMNVKHIDVEKVDLRPLGQEYLAALFKRLRRKDAPTLSSVDVPDVSVRFVRDFDSVCIDR